MDESTLLHCHIWCSRRSILIAFRINYAIVTSNLDCSQPLSPVWHPLHRAPTPPFTLHLIHHYTQSFNCILMPCTCFILCTTSSIVIRIWLFENSFVLNHVSSFQSRKIFGFQILDLNCLRHPGLLGVATLLLNSSYLGLTILYKKHK